MWMQWVTINSTHLPCLFSLQIEWNHWKGRKKILFLWMHLWVMQMADTASSFDVVFVDIKTFNVRQQKSRQSFILGLILFCQSPVINFTTTFSDRKTNKCCHFLCPYLKLHFDDVQFDFNSCVFGSASQHFSSDGPSQ